MFCISFSTERRTFQQVVVEFSRALHNSYYCKELFSDEEANAHLAEEHYHYVHLGQEFARADLTWEKDTEHADKLRKLKRYA